MGTEIVETEVIASPLKRINVGTQRLKVARSPTLRFMFFHSAFVNKMQAGDLLDDDMTDYFDEVVTLLGRYNDKVDEAKLKDECELSDLLGFYGRWFGGGEDEEEAGEERPPRRRGTTGGKRTASRSRSST